MLSWLAAWPEVLGRREARAAAEEALQLSRQAGDQGSEAHALLTLATLNFHEHGTLSLDLLEQARALAEQAHAYDAVLRAAVTRLTCWRGQGSMSGPHRRPRGASRERASTGGHAASARCSRPTQPNRWWRSAGGMRRRR